MSYVDRRVLVGSVGKEAELSRRTAAHILAECQGMDGHEFSIVTVADLLAKKFKPDTVINIHYGLLGDGGSVGIAALDADTVYWFRWIGQQHMQKQRF